MSNKLNYSGKNFCGVEQSAGMAAANLCAQQGCHVPSAAGSSHKNEFQETCLDACNSNNAEPGAGNETERRSKFSSSCESMAVNVGQEKAEPSPTQTAARTREGGREGDAESKEANCDRMQASVGGSISRPGDCIETLEFHSQLPSTSAAEASADGRKRKESKLFRATKAILLFKRAANSLGNDESKQTPGKCTPESSKSFVASLWRQKSADESTNRKSSRVDTFADCSAAYACSRSTSSIAAFLGGNSGGSSAARKASQQSVSARTRGEPNLATSSSSFSLPQFIVPKMNALKLPIVCLIRSLEGELMREIFIHRYEQGQYLMDTLKVALGLKDSKYFGLKLGNSLDEQEDVQQAWLNLNETVYKQITKQNRVITSKSESSGLSSQDATITKSVNFYLRIKFYPPNLARIQDQFLKQYLFLQLRRDLRLGKLTSSMNNLTYLMACVLQYELGDYQNELVNNQLTSLSVLPNQDLIEQQAVELWQSKLAGTKKHLVQMQFLRASVILETYGFDYYPVRDHQRQRAYLLGFNYAGVKTIRNGRIVNYFRWHNLSKISHERRMIIFHIYPNENSKRKQILGFKCLSNDECQNLYLRLLEQKYFFTVDLNYFDKSVRRPSHLSESSVEQLAEWSAATQNGLQYAGQPLYDHADADLAEDEEEQEEEEEEEELKSGPHGQAFARPVARTDDDCCDQTKPKESRGCGQAKFMENLNELRQSSSATDRLEYAQQYLQTLKTRSEAATMQKFPSSFSNKSSSFQDSCGFDALGPRPAESCNQRPTSPSAPLHCCESSAQLDDQRLLEQAQRGDSQGYCAQLPAGAFSEAHHALLQPVLQRQRPVCNFYNDHCLPGTENRQDSYAFDDDANQVSSMPLPESTVRDPASLASQGRCSTSPAQRLLSWTEQFLVEPATALGRANSWPAGQTGNAGRRPALGLSSDLVVQGLRLCLLILLLNFVLRMSDNLSGALIDLFTFRAQATSNSAGRSASTSFEGASDS